MRSLINLRKPVVAAANGLGVGIGATLHLHCDIVYACDNAQIQYPFVKLALCPEFASSILLPSVVGWQRAAELFLLGEPCPAQTAYAWGLVNKVFAPQDTLSSAISAAHRFAQILPESVLVTRSLMRDRFTPDMTDQFELELEHFRERLSSPEAKEAFKAFAERRPPDFSPFQHCGKNGDRTDRAYGV
ncbi:hypothetical protein HHL24_41240 [Paraburkholderia sp. RP-4-7]|uniref:Enoyl-CoA hydratase n=1 Tax=Paraburkholderia polaris TaxID=2728848 RepID=A0A848IVY9_9BURK|nr:hypothetical protein [Paraburkholderia polaris]